MKKTLKIIGYTYLLCFAIALTIAQFVVPTLLGSFISPYFFLIFIPAPALLVFDCYFFQFIAKIGRKISDDLEESKEKELLEWIKEQLEKENNDER